MNAERIAKLQQFLKNNPADSFTRYAIAMEYAGRDDAAAIRVLEELLRCDETYVPAYHQLGALYTRMNRVEKAREILRRGIVEANRQNDPHAASEMQDVLDGIRVE